MDTKLTPMLRQYLEIKKKHQEEVLFFRMGDFYEMFFEDAHIASSILNIALTKRQNDVPMCGLPYHAAENYIGRLIKAGKKVAICEQLETVPLEGNKIVRREVVRIVTPGTLMEENLLQTDDNNFLGSIFISKNSIGLAFVDISTGDFYLSIIENSIDIFRGEITRFNPKEIIYKSIDPAIDEYYLKFLKNRNIPVNHINEWLYDKEYLTSTIKEIFNIVNLKGIDLKEDIEILTAGSILEYLKETQKTSIQHLKHPMRIIDKEFMMLDDATISNLELVYNQQDRTKNQTIYSVLNHTKTAMGKRFLERAILQPLLNRDFIEKRLDIVQYFYEYHELLDEVNLSLKEIQDIERLISRFSMGKSFSRDFIALKNSIAATINLKNTLKKQAEINISNIALSIPDLTSLYKTIEKTICDEPALTPEHGRVVREGFNEKLDKLYSIKKDAKTWILQYQEEEQEKLDIPKMKIKYNKILGYYIEISKSQANKIPGNYLRKQTLVNAERYTTEKLQEFESDILSAADKITALEREEINKLFEIILNKKTELQKLAKIIGEIDYYSSLAKSAVENNFKRPVINDEGIIRISDGRHPIVEKYYTKEIFIPNDIIFDRDESMIKIITGPNMAGKSTYIRTAAIIQLLAQIGSFVPAAEASLSITDRIFTRIGASDNISRGESTFLVEMNETATILNNATDKSLIIMDEVGRGTSTYDGLSLAQAIVEYILKFIKAKTLFATHYHELTKLGEKKGIVNYNVLVKENINSVDFLHKVVPGSADKSYGIHVAKLAGIPKEITTKAEQILNKLESKSKKNQKTSANIEEHSIEQVELFNAANHLVVQAIKNIDLESITPIDALNELNRLKQLIE